MKSDPPADSSPDAPKDNVDESEVARLVEKYIDPTESVSEESLREHLQRMIDGTIVKLEQQASEVVVVVERVADDKDERVRDGYAVRIVTDLDGERGVDWSYLGPAN